MINKENLRAWQRSIGYVPQHIFLSDDTVAANIAFGVNRDKVDSFSSWISYLDLRSYDRVARLKSD